MAELGSRSRQTLAVLRRRPGSAKIWRFRLQTPGRPLSRGERSTITGGILCVVLTLLVLQLWLLTATMNAFLGGDESVVWPAAFASLGCLLLNLGLLWYLVRLD